MFMLLSCVKRLFVCQVLHLVLVHKKRCVFYSTLPVGGETFRKVHSYCKWASEMFSHKVTQFNNEISWENKSHIIFLCFFFLGGTIEVFSSSSGFDQLKLQMPCLHLECLKFKTKALIISFLTAYLNHFW